MTVIHTGRDKERQVKEGQETVETQNERGRERPRETRRERRGQEKKDGEEERERRRRRKIYQRHIDTDIQVYRED